MDKPPIQYEVMDEFKGQVSDTDPLECPKGAMYRQVNMLSIVNGQLTTRGGLKEITLDILE